MIEHAAHASVPSCIIVAMAPIYRDSLDGRPAELVAELAPHFPAMLRLRTRLDGQLSVHKTGDRRFDDHFVLGGPHADAVGALDHQARQLLSDLQDQLAIHATGLTARSRHTSEHTFLRIINRTFTVRSAYALGDRAASVRELSAKLLEHLAPPCNVLDEAFRRAREDPEPLVREVAIIALLARFEGEPRAREAALIGVDDNFHPHIRLQCATVLGPAEGLSIAFELLESRSELARKNAAAVAGRLADAAHLERILHIAMNDPLGAAVVHGLAESDRTIAEPALLTLIERSPGAIRRAAIEALATAGSIRAIPALDAIYRGEVREERAPAKTAIDAIRARLTKGEAGALALAPLKRDQGALSVSDSGAVSVVDES
jgi:hypothetical protein